MTYSEFGRRAAENASKGTDHGTVAPHFIVGGKVKGGVYGKHPSLKSLDKNDDLIYTTDFRSIYNSIAKKWFKISSLHLQSFSSIPRLTFDIKRNSISSHKPILPLSPNVHTDTKKILPKDTPLPSVIKYLLN